MTRKQGQTSMGGVGNAFLTTHWSLIEKTQADGEDKREFVGLLLGKYWKPVYCYLRRKGYDNDQAKDLTQGFFHEVVLGRELIQKADPTKGRFRSFLLVALNRYLINVREQESAQQRIPQGRLVSLDPFDPPELPAALMRSEPAESFHYGWVSALLEQVLSEVHVKCQDRDLTLHWQVFRDRLVSPILNGSDPVSMQAICEKYGIAETLKASNMITTVKRIFQSVLKEQIRSSVMSDEDAAEEFQQIKRFFPKNSAI